MFMPDYLSTPPAITQLRHQAITTWQHWQPRLQAVGIATIGVMMIAIAATIEAGRQTRDGWEWIYPRMKAAYQAFKNYQEPAQAPELELEPEPEPEPEPEALSLPNPYEAVERELLETLIAACQQPEETVLQDAPATATAPATAKRRGRPRKERT